MSTVRVWRKGGNLQGDGALRPLRANREGLSSGCPLRPPPSTPFDPLRNLAKSASEGWPSSAGADSRRDSGMAVKRREIVSTSKKTAFASYLKARCTPSTPTTRAADGETRTAKRQPESRSAGRHVHNLVAPLFRSRRGPYEKQPFDCVADGARTLRNNEHAGR